MSERPDEALLRLAIARVDEVGWPAYSVLDLDPEPAVPFATMLDVVGDRGAIVAALGAHADAVMWRVEPEDLREMSPRERVFEVVMRRFDALGFAKPAILELSRQRDPDVALAALGNLHRLVRQLARVAELPASPRGLATGLQLGRAYVQTGRIWLEDTSEDSATTLAELDRRLSAVNGLS